jgi:hypothetical protein
MTRQKATITFQATECATAREAVEQARALRGRAIRLDSKYLVVREEDAQRLAAAGISFAWLSELRGLILWVPVND